MYVVGANLLSAFWQLHPETEGELRALHALLVTTEAAQLGETLGGVATFNGTGAELKLRHASVRVDINSQAGIIRYAAVAPLAGEEKG